MKGSESRRDGRGNSVCRAYGTLVHCVGHPALKRWAKLCRPCRDWSVASRICAAYMRNIRPQFQRGLLDRDPATLGADQRKAREYVAQVVKVYLPEEESG